MKTFWFSFSYKGRNNGVCLVEADTEEHAKDKIADLKLIPDYDDMFCIEVPDMTQESSELEFNKIYSPEEMYSMGYQSQTTKI